MRKTVCSFDRRIYHERCRNGFYSTTDIKRFEVPDNLVGWQDAFPDYAPVEYTSPSIHGKPWADPDISDPSFTPKWNKQDGDIQRQSCDRYCHPYSLDDKRRPRNPFGRTGISGRGLLGRWGPNHAVDPLVTRWKNNPIEPGGKDVLQFVAIQRKDTKQWALPGGMVDAGETVLTAMKREFMEEALNSLQKPKASLGLSRVNNAFFTRGEHIFKGYVDDPRNTDNAWMETTVLNFHDNDGSILGKLALEAGDDACNARWMDIDSELDMYADHLAYLQLVTILRNAHWNGKERLFIAQPPRRL